ncbi:MAG: TetR/AcrR family transcriptional regulator, partial [Ruminococcus flavefaciens]|nr:TetR/AcrR family transcriptional regulator [Ruminococcus flavefaciens]
MSDIARTSEITKAAIFRHFKNKAELFSTMNERFFEAFETLAEKIASENDNHTFAAIKKSVDCVFEFDKEHPGYIEYYIQALLC